jgi:hypothetical protein
MTTNDENKNYISEKKIPIFITILIIAIGSVLYFGIEGIGNSKMESAKVDPSLFENIKLKAAFNDEGQMKVFALAENNKLAELKAMEGNTIPETGSMVIGYSEAMMMKEEKLFDTPGDKFDDFFGVVVRVEGILMKTGTMIDDFHFFDSVNFNNAFGQEDRLFVKLKDGASPKLFYTYSKDEELLSKYDFVEGSLSLYEMSYLAGEEYYPVVIGYKEAMMMKEEKLFSGPRDTIKGFFGKNVMVAGVLKETNTSVDMIHFSPLTKGMIEGE